MRLQLSIVAMIFVSCLSFGQVPAGIVKPEKQEFRVAPQAQSDYDAYMAAAGDASLLFRGQSALPYNFAYNGTYYWYTPKFEIGSVRFNGKDYSDVELNIDATRQVLICGRPGTFKRSELERAQVEYFTMGDRKFINAERCGINDVPTGYYEILRDGKCLFLKQRIKTLAEDREGSRALETDYEGNFNSAIWRVFVNQTKYYVTDQDGIAHQVKKRSDVYKVFKEYRKSLKKTVTSLERETLMPFEQFVQVVLNNFEEESR